MYRAVAIGRQCGSGGTEIGRLLAEQMEVPFYDKQALKEYAIEHGLGKIMMESYGEKHATSLLFSLSTSAYSFGYYDASQDSAIGQKAYLTAFETIRLVAKQGPCVIVGRCADHVLRDDPEILNVFIHAPLAERVRRVAQREGISPAEAEARILEQDRLRRNYYNYYTTKSWGDVNSYHMALDSGVLGCAGTAKLLERVAELGNSAPAAQETIHAAEAR